MESQHHLPARAAVKEQDRRTPLAGLQIRWKKELPVDRHPVSGGEDDLLRLDHAI